MKITLVPKWKLNGSSGVPVLPQLIEAIDDEKFISILKGSSLEDHMLHWTFNKDRMVNYLKCCAKIQQNNTPTSVKWHTLRRADSVV